MYCLDTYALIEIHDKKIKPIQDAVIPTVVFAEFYELLCRRHSQKTADHWKKKFQRFFRDADVDVLCEAIIYKKEHKVSFFDAVGYCYAQRNDLVFVTGDKSFANEKNVLYLK